MATMFSHKSLLILSLLAVTQALPHTRVPYRQYPITDSSIEVLSENGDILINIQTFNGTLGANPVPVYYVPSPSIGNNNRLFKISGVSYDNVNHALSNSCSAQMKLCVAAINDGSASGTVCDCNDQARKCNTNAKTISKSREFSAKRKRGMDGRIEKRSIDLNTAFEKIKEFFHQIFG